MSTKCPILVTGRHKQSAFFSGLAASPSPELRAAPCVADPSRNEEAMMGRGILLWLLGVPIPVIILLWLFFGH